MNVQSPLAFWRPSERLHQRGGSHGLWEVPARVPKRRMAVLSASDARGRRDDCKRRDPRRIRAGAFWRAAGNLLFLVGDAETGRCTWLAAVREATGDDPR